MSTERRNSATVNLKIEKTILTIEKDLLVSNSDYFAAMFSDGFIEKDKNVIEIKEVELRAMNIILSLLAGRKLKDDDVLVILEAVCMLQFDELKSACVKRLKPLLNITNCIPFWLLTDRLDIRPMCLKAKRMALDDFEAVIKTDSLGHLTLPQLCKYLGHVNLVTKNEKSVFYALENWWSEHGHNYKRGPMEDQHKVVLRMLSCIDYNKLTNSDLKIIMEHAFFKDYEEIKKVLDYISRKKSGRSTRQCTKKCQETAEKLLDCRSRFVSTCPCIVVNHRNALDYSRDFVILYYDSITKKLKKFINVDKTVFDGLEGSHFVGYKEFIYMFGGEYTIGKGNWNRQIMSYNNYKSVKWRKKTEFPYQRRHFEYCVVGDVLHIIGGIGSFRVNQDNTVSYDLIKRKWNEKITMPFFDRYVKCCNFRGQFFILSLPNRTGYYMKKTGIDRQIELKADEALLKSIFCFGIFSYENNLYIKGKYLIALEVDDESITVSSVKDMHQKECDKVEIVCCNDSVYTLYRHFVSNLQIKYTLEKYNMKTGIVEYIFQDINSDYPIKVGKETYTLNPSMKLFSFNHHSLVANDEVINKHFSY